MIGKVINGKYVIDCIVGSGGTATVYKAHRIDDNKTVAIKILKEEYQKNAEHARRFEREAQAGMQLVHGNIVKLLDTGIENAVSYIVFEFVNGKTLKEYINKKGQFNHATAVNIVSHILDAIAYAHEYGIIHRDVKPQNVMITTNGTVKLADFGIARAIGASTKTFTGSKVMGSVHYISPEQAAGKEATYQSDLYSVGIILYEMLTGQVPFDNENVVTVALMHMNERMKQPRELNPEISHSLNAVIMKATAKCVEDRYQTAEEMKADLARALQEPDGTFADMALQEAARESEGTEDEKKPEPKMIGKLNQGVFAVVVGLGSFFALFIIAFIIVQQLYNPTVAVQNVVGKSESEAQTIIEKSGLKVEITKEPSEENQGQVIRQDPTPGKQVQKGAKVKIVVAIGSDHTTAPNLEGMSLVEANKKLASTGLNIEKVEYITDSKAKEGAVCRQIPKANEEVAIGTTFTVYISGTPEKTAKVPSVADMKIDKAVESLQAAGFEKIFVNKVADLSIEEGEIISQAFGKGLKIDTKTPIVLEVSGGHGNAVYEGAQNITVESDNVTVIITVDTGKGYEIIVYEEILRSGSHTVPFTAYMEDSGVYDCVVYVAGKEFKRSTSSFASNE